MYLACCQKLWLPLERYIKLYFPLFACFFFPFLFFRFYFWTRNEDFYFIAESTFLTSIMLHLLSIELHTKLENIVPGTDPQIHVLCKRWWKRKSRHFTNKVKFLRIVVLKKLKQSRLIMFILQHFNKWEHSIEP